MTAPRVRGCLWLAALSIAPVLALAGCGPSGGDHSPPLSGVPLTPGVHVTVDVRNCNGGANAYCGLELVVVGRRYRTSTVLLTDETRLLRRRGWKPTNASTGLERGADSPGDRLRLMYATANGDLEGIDLGWIRRARPVTLALAHALFTHTATLSMFLQDGGG
jgi:hypothetical protein